MSTPSPLVRQIITLIEAAPTQRLVAFVPRRQLGRSLQRAVVQAHGAPAGFTATNIAQYAEQFAELSLRADGRTPLQDGPQLFLTRTILHSLPDAARNALTGEQPVTGLLGPLARTFTTLRAHDVSPAAYRTATPDTARHAAQARAFSEYEKRLEEHAYYDTPLLLKTATRLVENGEVDIAGTHWGILNTVECTGLAHRFISTLATQHDATGLYLLGPTPPNDDGSSPRPHTLAAGQYRDAPTPSPTAPSPAGRVALTASPTLSSEEADAMRFWTATGARREVQAVLEDIVERDRPLDTVEIAYTTRDPYLSLLDTVTERYDLPATLSGGRALEATRPGQMLRGVFDWIAAGGPIPDLIALLRAGLIRVDHPITVDGDTVDRLDARQAAMLLAQKRYGDDPTDHLAPLTAWQEQLGDDVADLKEATDADWGSDRIASLRQRRAAITAVKAVVKKLLSLGHLDDHNAVSLTDFAESTEKLLEQYGPTPKPQQDADDRTADEAARNRLLERLTTLADTEGEATYRPRKLAQHMTSWLSLAPYVRAQRPKPGHVHVVPLESAGVADREHLYVVGLDATSTAITVPDDPMLSDEERSALSETGTALPRRRAQVDVADWRTRQAIGRHTGTLTLSASTYDLSDDEELFETPLYLRLKDAAQSAQDVESDETDPNVTHHPLASDRKYVLSTLDRWTSRNRPAQSHFENFFTTEAPWIQAGLEAAQARASDTYTVYDGLLSDRSYAGLSPLSRSRPVSAGQLESYARSPFAYFLRHVLGVEPLDERALDDVAWLDARGRGAVLHTTFRRFMSDLQRRPTLDDKPTLERHFEDALEERRTQQPPPSEVVFATERRRLWTHALLFLRAEAARTDDAEPYAFELGFGYPPHRRKEREGEAPDDFPSAPTLHLGDIQFSLRGRIDRVDRRPDDTSALWDYKTGSARDYDPSDLLDGGRHLQWALYAYALEALDDTTVTNAGYFFTSTDEMGKRVTADPDAYRTAVARTLKHIADGITAGAFPVTDADALRYNYDRLFQDYSERKKQLRTKTWPDDRPTPPPLRDD